MALFSLTKDDDYASRKAAIARQEKLAELLSQMGAQEQAVSTAGGITAPMSGMGALARGLTSFGGSYLSGKAAKDAEALKKTDQEMAQKAVQNLYVMPAGSTQPDVGMVDTKGIEGAGPSFAVTGRTNLEDTATTPQQQLQMLSPLMQGGETSQAAYNAFLPQVMKRQEADVEMERKIKQYTPLIAKLPENQRDQVNALISADPKAGLNLVSTIFETNVSAPKVQRISSQLGGYDEITTSADGTTTRQHFDPEGNPTGLPKPDNASNTATNAIGGLPVIATKIVNNTTYHQTSDGKWHN
jgi:hypothetical protein